MDCAKGVLDVGVGDEGRGRGEGDGNGDVRGMASMECIVMDGLLMSFVSTRANTSSGERGEAISFRNFSRPWGRRKALIDTAFEITGLYYHKQFKNIALKDEKRELYPPRLSAAFHESTVASMRRLMYMSLTLGMNICDSDLYSTKKISWLSRLHAAQRRGGERVGCLRRVIHRCVTIKPQILHYTSTY